MKKNILFLILSLGFTSITIRAMEEMKASTDNETHKKFIEPEKVFEELTKKKTDISDKKQKSTAIRHRIYEPLAYNLNILFKKPWYIGFLKANGEKGLIQPDDEPVLMALDLLSTLYIHNKKNGETCSLVTHKFTETLNKYKELIKEHLKLTEISQERPSHNFSTSSFLLGSAITSLGLVSLLYAPELYYWLRNR